MPRVSYLDEKKSKVSADVINEVKKRRKQNKLLNLDRILLHSEPFMIGWQELFSRLRKNLRFKGSLRELIILRIAILNRAQYEADQHLPDALHEGVTQSQIDHLSHWHESSLFNEEEKAVLNYTDAMTSLIQVPDEIFNHLKRWFSEQQIVEITALIASYNMVSRFLEALQITIQGENESTS